MNTVILIIYIFSVLAAILSGRTAEAGTAVMEGAQAAVEFGISLCGGICLWSAVTELMEYCGIAEGLSRLLRPLLRRLFPKGSRDRETMEALSENVSANVLGLGNAATPAGIRAAKGLKRLGEKNELCMLVVLNTASVQLIPTTVASLRAALGASAPFDITPAVWFSSAASLAAGITAAWILKKRSR